MDNASSWLALIKEWWWVISVPGTLLLGFALAYLRTQFPTKGEFAHLQSSIDALGKQMDGRIDKVEQRASKLEGSLRDLPTRADIHKLELKSTELSGEMSAVRQQIAPMASAIDRIESYLLESKVPRR